MRSNDTTMIADTARIAAASIVRFTLDRTRGNVMAGASEGLGCQE
jgi:hypothetical protein